MTDIGIQIWDTVKAISAWEVVGLIAGLLCVVYLVAERIETWYWGVVYVVVSLVVFWQQRLYGDLLLHVVFLWMNIYGWIRWHRGRADEPLAVRRTPWNIWLTGGAASLVGIVIFAWFLRSLSIWWPSVPPASLPYWDSTTSVLSIVAIWLTAGKYISSWLYWLVVDILATCIYMYKGIPFYALLYAVYIGLAIWGWITWARSYRHQSQSLKA